MAIFFQAWVAMAVTTALLLSAATADVHSAAVIAAVPAPGPAVAVPAPAPAPRKPPTLHEKVVAALRAAGHYGAISGLLDSLGESAVIKEGITLFAPDDGAFDGLNMNSSRLLMTTLNYHVSTSVYNYQALANLPLNSTIATAAPNVVIFITSTGTSGLRLDDVSIADADLYDADQVAVHGITSVFSTAKYNKGVVPPEASPVTGTPAQAPGLITTPTGPGTGTGTTTDDKSDAQTHVPAGVVHAMLLVSTVSLAIFLL